MKVIIIGGGAAGMMAAYQAAKCGNDVSLYEKNEKLGKKIFITGKGRCNVTNACEVEELLDHVVTNKEFLYSGFYSFTNNAMMELLEELGCPLKVERGNRVFPVSDHSSDVIAALQRGLRKENVDIYLNTTVKKILSEDGTVTGVRLASGDTVKADKVIVATGGMSYQTTGSTGDGYDFARKAGHKVTKLTPALVPFEIKEDFCKQLMGLSLRNVAVKMTADGKKIYEDFGEMLFTHFGVSGPTILSSSAHLLRYKNVENLLKEGKIQLVIDLKPALQQEKLDNRIQRDFLEGKNKEFKNCLNNLLPQKMIDTVVELSKINPYKKVNEITREERMNLVKLLKNFTITISGFRPIEEGIVTSGGINVKEINPKTMESKIVNGLYFAGEIIDVDSYTGGFNLQIAYSTGFTAGSEC